MPSTMTFQFLDVGMGDGTLVQVRQSGQNFDTLVLVDFGELRTQFKVPLQDTMLYLKDTIAKNSKARKLDRPKVDYLFITHPDGDHYNRLADLCRLDFPGYQGKQLEFGDVYYGGKSSEYKDLIPFLSFRSTATHELVDRYHATINADGTVKPDFSLGDTKIYILSANYPSRNADPNPKSIVLLFDLAGQKVILQGDAEEPTEKWIISTFGHLQGFLNVVGHKLGHHGSNGATCAEWVAALKPKAIFASGDFVWAHPYCGPICRVLAANTLGKYEGGDLWYCCGDKGAYYNNRRAQAVCMNLWYFVKSPAGEALVQPSTGKTEVVQYGVTYGVQWALEVVKGAKPSQLCTDQVYPKDPATIPAGWNCGGALVSLARPAGSRGEPVLADAGRASGTVA